MPRVYSLSCRHAGVDCDFETRGEDVEDVMRRCAAHATTVHGVKSFDPGKFLKMRAQLKVVEESPVTASGPVIPPR